MTDLEISKSAKRICILVLGMHRSGTSALTGTLVKLGAAKPKTPIMNGADNLKGHWESAPLVEFHEELLSSAGTSWDDWRPINIDWFKTAICRQLKDRARALLASEFGNSAIFVFKDPRICRFLGFWLDIFAEDGISPYIIIPLRNPLEVAHSLKTRNGFTINQGLLLWLEHVIEAEANTRQLPRALIEMDMLLKDWRPVIDGLAKAFSMSWPRLSDSTSIEIDEFLTPDLKHERISDEDLNSHAEVHQWVIETFSALQELCSAPASLCALTKLDAIRFKFSTASNLFGKSLTQLETENQSIKNELARVIAKAQDADIKIEHLACELAKLSLEHDGAIAKEQARMAAAISEKDQHATSIREGAQALLQKKEEQFAHELAKLSFEHNGAIAKEQARMAAAISERDQHATSIREGAQALLQKKEDRFAHELTKLSLEHDIAVAEEQARMAAAISERDQLTTSETIRHRSELKRSRDELLIIERHFQHKQNEMRVAFESSRSWRYMAPFRGAMSSVKSVRDLFAMAQAGKNWVGGYYRASVRTGEVIKSEGFSGLKKRIDFIRYANSTGLAAPALKFAGRLNDSSLDKRLPSHLAAYLHNRFRNMPQDNIADIYSILFFDENIDDSQALSKSRATFKSLTQLVTNSDIPFDKNVCPTVSIIIPVHNHFKHTICCINSIISNKSKYQYEIIIADDASTDETREFFSHLTDRIVYIRNKTSLGFLRNCNKAAKKAKSDMIVFLNNDTITLPDWLNELVEPLIEIPSIGLTFSKLLNSDGTLQEAGGIFWSDGSAWNYGRNDDPAAFPYNFSRDSDYGSGASIAITKKLWDALGGFDEVYSPAYYEDSDLAFRVRAAGRQTRYVPFSELVHHEGVSHGRDETQGVKAFQAKNRLTFYNRWRPALDAEHFANGTNISKAAARSALKAHILIIDHYIPQPDRDAGSKSMDCLIRFFIKSGLSVTFWPENLYGDPNYIERYQRLGVEVVHGWNRNLTFDNWFAERGPGFEYVLASRPHITQPLLKKIRSSANTKLLYYGHDVHSLRMELQQKFDPLAVSNDDIERMRAQELDVWQNVDAIYYPSKEEADHVSALGDLPPAYAIPLYVFEETELQNLYSSGSRFSDGLTITFVGGFKHKPNVDGIIWFVDEIWPLVRLQVPEARLVIAGAEPPEEVTKLTSLSITVTGYITEEQLKDLYGSTSVVVAPLRYGAGVKGKVVEALRYGLPVVTTQVGAQGLAGVEIVAAVCDEPADFAVAIIERLNRNVDLADISKRSNCYVRENFSNEKLRAVFAHEMRELDSNR